MEPEKLFGLSKEFLLVDFSLGYRLRDFACEIEEYNQWIVNDAEEYIQRNISRVHLLVNRKNGDIAAYLALCTDSFTIEERAKQKYNFPFSTLPALKIGKLAVDKNYCNKGIGTYIIQLAIGMADYTLKSAGCRFITVDADIRYNLQTPEFYLRNGFVYNKHSIYLKRKENRSMRYDLFLEE
jgi:GNAT superfamily N-acetyltransferase